MIGLAEFERRIRGDRDFAVFDETHLHRAVREDDWGIVKTRDRVRAATVAAIAEEGAGVPTIFYDLGDMVAFESAQGWHGHRWARREGERIVAETIVIDGRSRARSLGRDPAAEAMRLGLASPTHPPLGELRAGQGQCAPVENPVLPHGFPEPARAEAVRLHRLWNARALHHAASNWRGPAESGISEADFVIGLVALLPDATITIERGLDGADTVAVLWRLYGHDAQGVRVRAIGSSVAPRDGAASGARETMLDTLSIEAQPFRPVIAYTA